MSHRRVLLLLAILAAVLLLAPLAAQAKRPEGVGRPTVTIVPPIPVLPGLPVPALTPAPTRFPLPQGTPAARSGPVEDPDARWLGPITLLSNRTGFQLWYTPTESRLGYVAGHRYHAVFKVRTRCTAGWTAMTVPNRAPYNLTSFVGRQLCYRVSGPDTEDKHEATAR
ncbi:MAG: hypothetical protein ACYCYF_05860 [Anaerolineae bacterium]